MKRVLAATLLVVPAACTTPQPVRDGAGFANAELTLLEAEVRRYVDQVNLASEQRTAQLLGYLDLQLTERREVEIAGHVGVLNQSPYKERYEALVALARRLNELDARGVEMRTAYQTRLATVAAPVTIDLKPFKTTRTNLAELSEELTTVEQLVFAQSYLKEVTDQFEAAREAAEKEAAEAVGSPDAGNASGAGETQ